MPRKSGESRPTINKDDSLALQGRGVGGEGGNMGETTAQSDSADASKSPLANNAGMDAMAGATRRASRTKSGSPAARRGKSAPAQGALEADASQSARAVGRMTRKGASGQTATSGTGRRKPAARDQKLAPKTLADQMKGYEGSQTADRETRRNPDYIRGLGQRGARANPKHETPGSGRRASSNQTNSLKLDQGAGGAASAGD